jgi:hypothetical protein
MGKTGKTSLIEDISETNDIISCENEIAELNLKDTNPEVKIGDDVIVRVKSNVFGCLIYKNQKSGDKTVWNVCGDEQEMTISDLRAMKASQSKFFQNQYIIILGVAVGSDCVAKPADIYKTLGITKYYENLVDPSDFKAVRSWSEKEIKEKVSFMSTAAQENLTIALNEYIKRGIIDSIKKIKAFEDALGCKFSRNEQ